MAFKSKDLMFLELSTGASGNSLDRAVVKMPCDATLSAIMIVVVRLRSG